MKKFYIKKNNKYLYFDYIHKEYVWLDYFEPYAHDNFEVAFYETHQCADEHMQSKKVCDYEVLQYAN